MTTLKTLIEEETTITAYCGIDCGAKRDLDLKGMAKAYGEDFDLTHYTVAHRLRCHVCNKVGQMTIRVHDVRRKGIVFDTNGKLMK